jgi:hypothetical protein
MNPHTRRTHFCHTSHNIITHSSKPVPCTAQDCKTVSMMFGDVQMTILNCDAKNVASKIPTVDLGECFTFELHNSS